MRGEGAAECRRPPRARCIAVGSPYTKTYNGRRCSADSDFTADGLIVGLGLLALMRVLDLQSRFRYRQCDQRGKVVVSVKWANVNSRRGCNFLAISTSPNRRLRQ